MSLNPEDTRPASQQVADLIRAEIASGSLAPGDRVPSVRDLASRYNIAPLTAQSAVSILRKDGLVYSSPGRGTFVKTGADAAASPNDDLAQQLADVRGRLEELAEAGGNGQALEELRAEVADLRRAVGILQAQLIDLYGRTGQQYPHGSVTVTSRPETSGRRVG
jgi:DNA-binding transcriptional regulator YhcF (GntR family)